VVVFFKFHHSLQYKKDNFNAAHKENDLELFKGQSHEKVHYSTFMDGDGRLDCKVHPLFINFQTPPLICHDLKNMERSA
jgi:hypothetical protein